MSWSLRLNLFVAIIAEIFRVWRQTRSSSKSTARRSFSPDLPVPREFHHEQEQLKI